MIGKSPRLVAIGIGCLVGTIASAPLARAEDVPTHLAEPTPDMPIRPPAPSPAMPTGSAAFWPYQPRGTLITKEQLDAFAALVGESTEVVWRRLTADPGLAPLAVEAADARMRRQRMGKFMTTVGLASLGLGIAAIVFGSVKWSNSDSSKCKDSDVPCDQMLYFELVAAGGLAAVGGLVFGCIGLNKMDSPSEAETKAFERYKPLGTGRPPTTPPLEGPPDWLIHRSGPSGKTVRLTLLSLSF